MQNTETLLDWLRQTHALEESAINVTQRHLPRLNNYPYLTSLLSANAEESRAQTVRLRACLEALGGAPPAPDQSKGLLQMSQALSGVFDEESATKGLLAVYALKHLEIGSYRILVKTADRCDEPDVAAICRHSLAEELEMASQIEAHLEMRQD